MSQPAPTIRDLAKRHIGTGNQTSARYVFEQGEQSAYHDKHEANERFLRSLVYSVGINHHDYIAAFRAFLPQETHVAAV